MPKITFIDHEGTARTVDAEIGQTVMETAIHNVVTGIDADCGGACACGTCHVYVDEAFLRKLDPPNDFETPMLAFIDDVRPNSRLACQIKVTEALDGLRVTTPATQQ